MRTGSGLGLPEGAGTIGIGGRAPPAIASRRSPPRSSRGQAPRAGRDPLRAALWACQDVDPYNAFNGLGFDGTDLTLPEFIVDNIAFDAMGPDAVAHIALPDPVPCAAQ